MSFKNKTVFITGASRGIGKAIALKLAKENANIIVVAKSIEENPKLGGTIFSAAKEIEETGGKALPLQCDIRFEDQIESVMQKTIEKFGAIDILINNASAISLTSTEQTESKRFDLMHSINVRGTFLVTKACVPFLKKSSNPHILTLSPPLNLDPKWFANHIAYTITKYGMSMMTIGWAAEFKKDRIAANSLWPKTTIATAAVKNLLGGEAVMRMSRTPEILADAAYHILRQPSTECTGNLFIDEEVLTKEGIIDFDKYAVIQGGKLLNDLFV
ncbi:MAG TPA: NAD(P)-dependent oxidoreductase [Chitinophagaceae bacterium]|jgi:citronellol/citronellal dehydrogenase|nr:NAD(P)-dependent oxidoreductase [Chitinophagaceae bacterium]